MNDQPIPSSRTMRQIPVPLIEGVDYYFEGPLMVFTAEYHRQRGTCCRQRCRHCPWDFAAKQKQDLQSCDEQKES